jgi:uncharacterized protein YbjQ (UPF0145 family)
MIVLTTTNELQDRRIVRYLGVVTAETFIVGNPAMEASRNPPTDRFAAYKQQLRQAKNEAVQNVQAQATQAGGNAVIGVKINYSSIAPNVLMVSVQGTALFYDQQTA